MLIDWFTVIAQLINFLILVFLLHRFLYKPILKTIKSRQTEIEHRWQETEEQRQAAEAEAHSYQQKQQELAQKQQAIIAQAQEQGEQEYHNLVAQARRDVDQKQADWEAAIARQQDQFFENLQQKVTEQVYAIARRAFDDLADVSLEKQVVETFIERLQNLNDQEQERLARSLQTSENGLIIRSHFEMMPESREKLLNALHQQQIYEGNHVQFTTTPDLICGIELQASDYKIAWTLQRYLQSLDQHLAKDFPQLN